jgi:uncharacterized SAM-binding protein YcdF (DUF218 family)
LRTLAVLATIPLGAFLLVCGLVFLQAEHDETRHVDAIVVLDLAPATDTYLDHAITLYRQGYAPHLVLTGDNVAEAQEHVISQGVPDTALLLVEPPEESAPTQRTPVHQVASLIQQHNWYSVLLVNDPHRLLLNLKMARDAGLAAYGAPLPDGSLTLHGVLAASLDYWQYVLLGSPE